MNIVNPYPMQWESKYKELFPDAVWSGKPLEGHDTYLFMWCTKDTVKFIMEREKTAKYYVFIRRFELFTDLRGMDWSRVDKVFMVNDALASAFGGLTGVEAEVVYNGVDPSKWTFTPKGKGNKIAWVGYINMKKNLPLAIQIMKLLPDYELHIAGEMQDAQTVLYMQNIVPMLGVNIYWSKGVPRDKMNEWYQDKHYILSTAISEGCPNNVIEGMACGLRPVVHNWPGARQQFKEYVFDTVGGAFKQIQSLDYNPFEYRKLAESKFGENNYLKVRDIVCGKS